MGSAGEILVADIGGTNARFALAIRSEDGIALNSVEHFKAKDFDRIEDAVGAYLEQLKSKPLYACFAVAGPISDTGVEFTNSHWYIDLKKLEPFLRGESFLLVNDFAALSMGVQYLSPDDITEIKPGREDLSAPRLVVGAGTGFGQAILLEEANACRVISTEGGHASFAPETEEEIEILKILRRRHGRVSVERLLSGQGLVNIYQALSELRGCDRVLNHPGEITALARLARERFGELNLESVERIPGIDPEARQSKDLEGFPDSIKAGSVLKEENADADAAHARDAVTVFCNVLGGATGDAVLSSGARRGVFIGGGIVPRIYEILQKSDFGDRFVSKGRMRSYLEPVKVHLITSPDTALKGAAALGL